MGVASVRAGLDILNHLDFLTDRALVNLYRLFSGHIILIDLFLARIIQGNQRDVGIVPHQVHVQIVKVRLRPGLLHVDVVAGAVHHVAGRKARTHHFGILRGKGDLFLLQHGFKLDGLFFSVIGLRRAERICIGGLHRNHVCPVLLPYGLNLHPFHILHILDLGLGDFPVFIRLDGAALAVIDQLAGFVVHVLGDGSGHEIAVFICGGIRDERCTPDHGRAADALFIVLIGSECIVRRVIGVIGIYVARRLACIRRNIRNRMIDHAVVHRIASQHHEIFRISGHAGIDGEHVRVARFLHRVNSAVAVKGILVVVIQKGEDRVTYF